MTARWSEIRSKFRVQLAQAVAAVSVLVATIALLWGPGLLRRPDLVVSAAAIDMKVPSKFKMEMFWLRMLLEKPDIASSVEDTLAQLLTDSGLSDERVAAIIGDKKDVGLEPYEQNIVDAAFAKATVQLQNKLLDAVYMPEAVLFFEVRNDGSIAAEDVHIVVRLRGTPYDMQITTDSSLTASETVGPEYRMSFARIAPGSITKVTIWYARSGQGLPKENEIVVSYDRGTVRQQAPEGSVVLGWK